MLYLVGLNSTTISASVNFKNMEKDKTKAITPTIGNTMLAANASDRNEHFWRRFCRLGEMMGDGLHYEPDGKWIAKEYRKLAKMLIPEMKTAKNVKK